MSEVKISFRRNPNTGKQDIVVTLGSEPVEHEKMHKALAEVLLSKRLDDFGEIVVERENPDQNT